MYDRNIKIDEQFVVILASTLTSLDGTKISFRWLYVNVPTAAKYPLPQRWKIWRKKQFLEACEY